MTALVPPEFIGGTPTLKCHYGLIRLLTRDHYNHYPLFKEE